MTEFGLKIKSEAELTKIEVQCVHQNGLIYVVPSESSWVCTEDLRHVHALSGFFKQLIELEDPKIQEAMQKWGIYFRPRPLADDEQS
ncbi:MAG: hypothetical protein CL904_02205 [Dehalococcoidia bacterium]|nr:hypothetical protein [Dehalococcoidia bacterium]MQG15544.1 hypothetical protein [SAR202 cluster bacterium]|tara:strand:- start:1624 stop:1884 length:261 start_codon:yes stop_codon:yes gene_type:complete